MLPFIVQWVHGGADVPGSRVMRYYQSIMAIQSATVAATEPYDAVLSPVAPGVAFPAEWPMPFGDEDFGMAHIGFTAPYNMSGQPAGTVNCGFTARWPPDRRSRSPAAASTTSVCCAPLHWYENSRPAQASPDWPVRASSGHDGRKVSGGQSVGRAHG